MLKLLQIDEFDAKGLGDDGIDAEEIEDPLCRVTW